MDTAPSRREPNWVVLLVGLAVILLGSQAIVLATVASWALGVAVGVLMLLVAWRVSPPPHARVLSRIVAILGGLAVLIAIYAFAIGGLS